MYSSCTNPLAEGLGWKLAPINCSRLEFCFCGENAYSGQRSAGQFHLLAVLFFTEIVSSADVRPCAPSPSYKKMFSYIQSRCTRCPLSSGKDDQGLICQQYKAKYHSTMYQTVQSNPQERWRSQASGGSCALLSHRESLHPMWNHELQALPPTRLVHFVSKVSRGWAFVCHFKSLTWSY